MSIDESGEDDSFWDVQKKVISDFKDREQRSLKGEQQNQYNERAQGLVSETVYFSVLIFSAIWLILPNPFAPFSYLLGALLGTAYTYGLGKFVATVGGTVDDIQDVEGSGVGAARFAFLILLFLLIGKFSAQGLEPIPAIMGFFTYQLATLSQGLKEMND